jgi:hypothetical protein
MWRNHALTDIGSGYQGDKSGSHTLLKSIFTQEFRITTSISKTEFTASDITRINAPQSLVVLTVVLTWRLGNHTYTHTPDIMTDQYHRQ